MIGGAKPAEQPTLLRELLDARSLTDQLFEIVRSSALYERPIAERHRLIFYLGHLEAFDWNLFRHQSSSALKSFHPAFDQLFAFGIDPVDGGLPNDQPHDWPSIAQVQQYNQRLRREIDAFLETDCRVSPHALPTLADTFLHVAIEHRLMHAETLAYLFHRMPYEQKKSQHQSAVSANSTNSSHPEMLTIPAGRVSLGLPRNGIFGWDNEFLQHQADVPQFLIDKFMVSNADFLEFLNAGGYDNRALWRDSDWLWIQSQEIRHPAFWRERGSEWLYRGMFEEIPLPFDWPVYISHAEARAFARWTGKSLPTEAQWHRAAYGDRRGPDREFPWGNDSHTAGKGNFHFTRWDPAPVAAYPENVSAFGVAGMLGNGWEWCSSEFAPFPGFQAFPFYPGYSANFFDGQHFVLKGGSPRTAAPLLRRSFRNWFQAHYQYAYTGFRCVKNPDDRRPAC